MKNKLVMWWMLVAAAATPCHAAQFLVAGLVGLDQHQVTALGEREDQPVGDDQRLVHAPVVTGLLDLASWRRGHSPGDWRAKLSVPEGKAFLSEIRAKTHRGRPLGSDRFISKLETVLGRRLHALSRGRPRNKGSGKA